MISISKDNINPFIETRYAAVVDSKVRSYHGLMVHVFGTLAAALFILRERENFCV
ncbi:MAG: hypothetical protein ACRCXC_05375 [Legionella sp.]